jgi:hypothetical protein
MESEPNPSTMSNLWTAVVRCHLCLRTLSIVKHIDKKPGIRVDYNECPKHPESGCIIEWEPE